MHDVYAKQNAAERERLVRLTTGLTEEQLKRPLPNGWTVATKLLHLAFWDQYCLALLRAWKHTSVFTSSLDVDAINHAVRVLSEAIPASAVVPLVRAAAEAVDKEIESIGPELRAAIEGLGRARLLQRWIHRREHLEQMFH